MIKINQKINPENDLGLGNQALNQRVINRDGSINVKRKGLKLFSTADNFHQLITMSWAKFWLLVLTCYILTNVLFAFIYVSIGNNLNGAEGSTPMGSFLDAFFFSAQTLSTVGYGHISPKGVTTNFIAALESMIGLLAFALATGLLYGRFSRPSAKIVYSKNILIAPYRGNKRGLMFRLANLRRNMLLELSVEVIFSYNDTENGKVVRKFLPLELERSRVNLLTLNWTVVHPLDEESPLKDYTIEDFKNASASVAVLMKAFDETFAQTIHSRTSYEHTEMVWGARFKPAFQNDPSTGQITLDLNMISTYEPAELPS